jgi:alginate O-acetyltransferase complex protein AlgI
MLFNSINFILFFIFIYILYWYVFNKNNIIQNLFLLISSYFFYGAYKIEFLFYLIIITTLDFFFAFLVANKNKKIATFFLILGIINNLGFLFYFKYKNFFFEQINYIMNVSNSNTNNLEILLPIGISFYIFHGLSYLFDIYNKKILPLNNIVDYSLFVSFFPLLVAGPIERATHLIPQIKKNRIFNEVSFIEGCRLILWGLFKKIIIADGIAEIIDPIYSNIYNFDGLTLFICSVCFSFQIYADFSGYSDIAIGLGKLLGFELLSNFKFPYFATNISEFWKRWHISLSSWFRDYIYIPLGGSKNGIYITIRNVFLIFIISGLWHGASYNFLIWGGLHGFAFILFIFYKKLNLNLTNRILSILFTFSFVTFSWIFFRISSFKDALYFIKKIALYFLDFNSNNFILPVAIDSLPYLFIFIYLDFKFRKNERNVFIFKNTTMRYLSYLILTFILYLKITKENNSFIYFQF